MQSPKFLRSAYPYPGAMYAPLPSRFMRSNGKFPGYQFFIFGCSAPMSGTLRWTSNQKPEILLTSLGRYCFIFPHNVIQHFFFVVSDSLTEQCEKYTDKLAANGYDRLFFLQRII